jgi:DNA-binding response OmpR family regulator
MTTAKPAILLLLPDARLRDIYVSRFERDGWEVDAATNLVDAERRAVQLRPSILFVHHSILENVKATFKRLRGLPTLLKTRIVVADKHLPREAVEEALGAGAHEVVMTAHLTPQALVKRMNQIIEEDL